MESTKFNDNLDEEDPCKCIDDVEEKKQNESILVWRETDEDGTVPFNNFSTSDDFK